MFSLRSKKNISISWVEKAHSLELCYIACLCVILDSFITAVSPVRLHLQVMTALIRLFIFAG